MTPNDYRGLAVIVPTRNRSDVAIRAVRSVLAAGLDDVRVYVSDNSTAEEHSARLGAFCRELDHPRVRYLRPPEPLAMSPHWEWAFQRVLDDDPANHLTVLGDRRMFIKGALARIRDLLVRFPGDILVYEQMMLNDHLRPISLGARPHSGELYEVAAADLIRANSRGAWFQVVPLLQNCVVTRDSLDRVRERFGDWFLSVSPDYAFGFKALNVVDRVLFLDRFLILGSELKRSNGHSMTRGAKSPDHADFLATNPQLRSGFASTPIPEIVTAWNASYHEYGFVRSLPGAGPMPEIHLGDYIRRLRDDINSEMANSELKHHYLELLDRHASEVQARDAAPAASATQAAPLTVGRPRKSLAQRAIERALNRRSLRGAWRFAKHRLGLPVPAWAFWLTCTFDTVEEAVAYVNDLYDDRDPAYDFLAATMPAGLFAEPPYRLVDASTRPDSPAAGRGRADGAGGAVQARPAQASGLGR